MANIIKQALIGTTTYDIYDGRFGYGTCSTAAATAAKTVAIADYLLRTGSIVTITFANNVPASATLNISSTGAKPIYYRGAAITADTIFGGDTVMFVYTGANYLMISTDRPVTADTYNFNGGTSTTVIA